MLKRHRITANQSGFTLVEIAIVLVIIGLLIGGILKGQELINNAKIKAVANELQGVKAAYYAYIDRYRAVPGDDLLATTRFDGADNGGGNGTITGLFDATTTPLTAATESQNFWQHVRMAGLMSGAATATDALPPANPVRGVTGVEEAASTFGMTGPCVCTSNVPWKIAQAVDILLDDGASATGIVRAGVLNTPAVAAGAAGTDAEGAYGPAITAVAANIEGFHTLCMSLK